MHQCSEMYPARSQLAGFIGNLRRAPCAGSLVAEVRTSRIAAAARWDGDFLCRAASRRRAAPDRRARRSRADHPLSDPAVLRGRSAHAVPGRRHDHRRALYGSARTPPPADDEVAQFVATVLGYTEDTWGALFEQMGQTYRQPTLVLFSGQVGSACGFAHAAMGPFYCPADREGVHRPQLLSGAARPLRRARRLRPGLRDRARGRPSRAEPARHRASRCRPAAAGERKRGERAVGGMELQADCLAGVWAHHTEQAQQFLERGDIEEGLNAAAAIGDDRIQSQTQGYVVPPRPPPPRRGGGGPWSGEGARVGRRAGLQNVQRRAVLAASTKGGTFRSTAQADSNHQSTDLAEPASKSTRSQVSTHASKSMLGRVSQPRIAKVIEPRVHREVQSLCIAHTATWV